VISIICLTKGNKRNLRFYVNPASFVKVDIIKERKDQRGRIKEEGSKGNLGFLSIKSMHNIRK
jgi:hypothetical protein